MCATRLCCAALLLAGLLPAASLRADDLANRARDVLRKHCHDCHGGRRTSGGVKVLQHAALLETGKIVPGKPQESQLFQLVTTEGDNVMPPEGRPRLQSDDVDVLRRWIEAGAAPFAAETTAATSPPPAPRPSPEVLGNEYVLRSILSHVRRLPAEYRPFVRYFSLNHLLAEGATEEELELHRDALLKAINHLSWERDLVRPRAIEATNTVFGVDIRRLGWNAQPFSRVQGGRIAGRSTVNLFDLALLEYPYAMALESSPLFDRLTEEFLVPARQVRPIPYVRGDWFASMATQPPLYNDFLRLPLDVKDLETRLGVDARANLDNLRARRAGVTVSGVSRNNRVVERHPAQFGAYWKSFDFRTSRGDENIFRDPVQLRASGGEMIFHLPNGMQGYYIADGAGKRLDAAPTEIVTDKFADDKTVRNGLACMRCHDGGLKPFADTVRPAVLRLPANPGFDRRQVLSLYPRQEEMDRHVKEDSDRFTSALTTLLRKPATREPLVPVSKRFLDTPLRLASVAAELGLGSPEGLQYVFGSPQLTTLGLAPLASNGEVSRDLWENYFDQVTRTLGLGVPVVPLDGVGRPDFQPGRSVQVTLQTSEHKSNKTTRAFRPGDELVVWVTNKSRRDLYIELVATSGRGRKAILAPSSTVVKAGQTYRYPAKGGLKIEAGMTRQLLTVLASEKQFPAGEVIRGRDMADRVVHPFYQMQRDGTRLRLGSDAAGIVKKSLEVEVR